MFQALGQGSGSSCELDLVSSLVAERVEFWGLQYGVVTVLPLSVWEHGWSLTKVGDADCGGRVRKDLGKKG